MSRIPPIFRSAAANARVRPPDDGKTCAATFSESAETDGDGGGEERSGS